MLYHLNLNSLVTKMLEPILKLFDKIKKVLNNYKQKIFYYMLP